jgi:hypothetical protein
MYYMDGELPGVNGVIQNPKIVVAPPLKMPNHAKNTLTDGNINNDI